KDQMNEDDLFLLNGEWAFYWKQFLTSNQIDEMNRMRSFQYISVPSDWTSLTNEPNGFATYSLTLQIPENRLGNVMGIYIPYQYSSYSLWMEGVNVASNGFVGTKRASSEPTFKKEVAFFTPKDTEIQVIMHIANFEHPIGGFNRPIYFGTADAITNYYTNLVALTLFVIGGILIMGIYQLGIYVFRRKEKAFLFFGLLSILVAFRALFEEPLFITVLFPHISWIWQHRLEFIVMYTGYLLYLFFLRSLYPSELKKWVLQGSVLISVLLMLITTVSYPIVYKPAFDYFLLLAAITMVYTLYVLIVAVKRKRRTAILNLTASIIFFLTILNDIFLSFDWIRSLHIATFGFFIYIFVQSLNLSRNYAQKFQESESLTNELMLLNQTLDEKIERRTQELSKTNAKLRELTIIDGLTGVNNRRFFDEKMLELSSDSLERGLLLTFLLIDLDEFKKYNDSYGHIMGDELIKKTASLFKEIVGADGYVTRYGGEEFGIILPNKSEEDGREIAERICREVRNMEVEHFSSSVSKIATISIGGTSSSHHDHKKPKDWIQQADKALYASKKSGKNQVTMM
ncbi:MAG: diguanylate cyclase, partial [Paenisporosarcina sp.]|nr:diguanylate cyclase [Paenisporosarcina sp.]